MSCFVLLIVLTGFGIHKYQEHKQYEREQQIRRMYHRQGLVYPRTKGSYFVEDYFNYDNIDEKELYIELITYNICEDKSLTLDDVKEYLSEQYNEDGTLRVETGWDEIYDFENWWGNVGSKECIPEYKEKLWDTISEFRLENQIDNFIKLSELSYDQIDELSRKIADPDYEIDKKVMGYGYLDIEDAEDIADTAGDVAESARKAEKVIDGVESGIDTKIKPSNPYNVDAKPSGTVTKITNKMDEATKRSLMRENEAAETIAKNGYNIEQNPVIEGTTRNPDYIIEGEIFDCYSPAENTKIRNVASTIEEKVIKKVFRL